MFGCADAEQGQAAGQHRPGGFGEREPGTVGGRGFLVAERQHAVLKTENSVCGHDKMPRQPVGRPMPRGETQGMRIFGQGGEEVGFGGGGAEEAIDFGGGGSDEGGAGGPGRDTRTTGVTGAPDTETHTSTSTHTGGGTGTGTGAGTSENTGTACGTYFPEGGAGVTEGGGVAAQGAGAGVGVTDAEERVVLALEKMVGADPGLVVRRGVEQRPASGVVAEGGGVLGRGHGPEVHRLEVADLDTSALGGDDPYEGVGDDLGPGVVGHAQLDDLPGEGVAVPVARPLLQNHLHQVGEGATREGDVEETGSGDGHVGDTGITRDVRPQDLGDLRSRPPGRTGEPQRDVRGVVPAPTRPRRGDHRTRGHGDAQFPHVDSTTHRAQHGTGELDGSHGTSLGERGGRKASRFG